MKKNLLIAGMTLAIAASNALGATISYTVSDPTTLTSTPFSVNFSLPDFNTALGILNSVTLSYTALVNAEIDVFNTSSTPQNFTNASASVPVTIVPFGDTADEIQITVVATLASGTTTVNPGSSAFTGNTATQSGSSNPTDLVDFEGSGSSTFSLTASGSGGSYSGTGPSGILFFGGNANVAGNATVTYNYTVPSSTPEPATMTLFGSALLGIGFFARKRIKKA